MSEQAVVLFSGGVDSLAALLWAQERYGRGNVLAVYCNIGQRYAKKEIKAVEEICKAIGQKYVIEDRLFLGDNEKPMELNSIIPYRNSFLILLAASHLPEEGGKVVLQNVIIGEDSTWDRRAIFNEKMQVLLNYADPRRVELRTPHDSNTKKEIIQALLELSGNDYDLINKTISCYSDEEGNCGHCNSCFRAYVAMRASGIPEDIVLQRFRNNPAEWEGVKQYVARMKAGLYNHKRKYFTLKVFPEIAEKCRVYAIDMDGIICYEGTHPIDKDNDKLWKNYFKCRLPKENAINKINKLYTEGNSIIIHTSRRESDREITENWLKENNVKYHRLVMEKPLADAYIDDRNLGLWDFD